MTYPLTVPERLLTWLDVERVLKQKTQLWSLMPEGVQSVDCYHDGMDIAYSADRATVEHWLKTVFGKAFSTQPWQLSLRAGDGVYPIRLEQAGAGRLAGMEAGSAAGAAWLAALQETGCLQSLLAG